jgi:Cu/Ag efflux pump CusA
VRSVLNWALQFRVLIFFLSALVIFIGVTRLGDSRIDVLPEFAPPYVEIQTEALGLSAREVEDLVTLNVEELLSATPWVRSIRSRSVPGLSSVILLFEPGTDLMRARQVVQERLTFAYALPNVSKPPVMLNPLSATSRVMIVGVSSKSLSLVELSVLHRFVMKPKLLGVPGVANVSAWGERMRQLQVQVDPERLLREGVTLDQVIKTAGNAMWVSPLSYLEGSTPGAGGWIDTPTQRLTIQHTLPISTPDDLAQITVEGSSLALRDVAKVVEGYPPLIGDALLNGGPGLLLVVEKLPHVDARKVVQGLEAALDTLRQGLPGVEIDSSIYRSTSFLETAIHNVSRAALIGAVLLIMALLFLFYEWRAAMVSATAVLLSMLTAGLVLYAYGVTLNIMVLAGFLAALVVVVDDAVVDAERILRRLRENAAGRERPVGAIVVDSLAETRSPLLYATLIIILLLLPVFVITGVAKPFFEPFAASYLLALLASTVVAVTATPALASALWRTLPGDGYPPIRWLQRWYQAALPRALEAQRAILVATGVVILAGIVAWPLFAPPSFQLLPRFYQQDVRISWNGVVGTSYAEMLRTVKMVSEDLRSIPGVSNVAAHLGRAVTGDQIVNVDAAQIWVKVDPKADYDATLTAINQTIDEYPGLQHETQTYLQQSLRQVFTARDSAIVVRLRGPDWDGLHREAERVKQALSEVDGLVDVRVKGQVPKPQIEVQVDLAAAARYGLKPGDVRRAAATMFSGIGVGSLFEYQKIFDVVVWSIPSSRESITNVRELLIDTPGGGHVRLGDVAKVRVLPAPSEIEREGISRAIDIMADVPGRDVNSATADVARRLKSLEFPSEYYPDVRADGVGWLGAQHAMLVAALAALIGIFFLLQACFRSWHLALAVLLAVPVVLIGPIVAVLIGGNTVLLGSLIGSVTVLALVVRQAVLFVRYCQDLELSGEEVFGLQLVQRASREQFAPVLMAAMASGLAMLPFIYDGAIAGLEIIHPMVIVILCGLVSTILFNLFVMPALYLSFGTTPEPELRVEDADYGRASNATP